MDGWSILVLFACLLPVSLVIMAVVVWSNRRWWPELRYKSRFHPTLDEVLAGLDESERQENRKKR
jgi:hypothetical protein